MVTITVTKLDAAHRQLDCAIQLWTHERDAVSIHTLACAAHQIVADLARQRGVNFETIYNTPAVKNEYRREFIKVAKKDMNFFKHADEDSGAVTTLDTDSTEMFLLFAIAGLEALGETKSDEQSTLLIWQQLHRPEILTAEGARNFKDMFTESYLNQMRKLSRLELYQSLVAHRAAMRLAKQ